MPPRRGAAWSRLALHALLLAACRPGGGADVPPRGDYRAVAQTLQPFIEREMAEKKLPALSIALVDNQEIVWARGFGFARPADSIRATAATVYRVGSIAKLFTTIGVLQLVEQGKVDLDAPVERYLPGFKPANRFGGPVTVRHLLAHRSGLAREPPAGSLFDSSRVGLAEVVQSLNTTDLVYPPGSRTKYSNAGMAVAGYLLEQVSGEPFESRMARAVLEPMGLRHTSFGGAATAEGHLWTYDGRTSVAPAFRLGNAPASGLASTARDLAQFARALFDGGRGPGGQVLRPETVERMWTLPPGDPSRPVPADFGLGFWLYSVDGRRQVGHWGSYYGQATDVALLPAEKLAAVVIATEDQANAVIARIANAALGLMLAAKQGRTARPLPTTQPVPAALAKTLDGRYAAASAVRPNGRPVELEERNGRLFYHRDGDDAWFGLRTLGDTLVVDDRLAFGQRILPLDGRIVVEADTLGWVETSKPAPAPERWRALIGEYGWDYNTVYVREEGGRLHALVQWFFDYPLEEESPDRYRFPDNGLYHGERLSFSRDRAGRPAVVRLGSVVLSRRHIAPEDGSTFKIVPSQPAEALLRAALAATPPVEKGEFLKPDLIEVARLDPTIKLDLRYATTNNFVSTAFYKEGKAFLQRPAAEALVRVNRSLRTLGYGLLIHDSYRPWYVTKMFWDATPPDKKVFVANPAAGSRHNRGCAVDLTLYDLRTGKPIEMVSGYDEFSDRAYPDYPGGTSLQRWHRHLLRRAMEAEGFTVYDAEWWHFDYRDWRRYPILNVRFEDIRG